MNLKYEEAYYIPLCGEPHYIKIEQLISEANNYKIKYSNRLYCPECHKPQLTLVERAPDEFCLRGFQRQKHKPDCTKGLDVVSKKSFNEYIDNVSDFSINKRLSNILNRLLSKEEQPINPMAIKIKDGKCIDSDVLSVNVLSSKNIKAVPIKSLTAPFDDDDYGCYKIFYGDVDIVVSKKMSRINGNVFYVMNIFRRNSTFVCCSLSMSVGVASYLNKKYNILAVANEKRIGAYISFVTELYQKDGKYINGRLKNSEHCVINML